MNENKDIRIDPMPMLVVVLVVITLFVLLRPPILLLLSGEPITVEEDGLKDKLPQSKLSTPPIPVPPLPSSLDETVRVAPPARWTNSISIDPATARMSEEIHTLTNEERVNVDLKPLEDAPVLAAIAIRHSQDMVDNDYLAHTSKEGDGPPQRTGVLHRRLFGLIGENVALYDSQPVEPRTGAAQFMRQWMNSLGHRRNILSESFNQLGVGCFERQDSTTGQVRRRCTQLFARAFAYSMEDVPEQLSIGERLPISITSRPGVLPAVAIAQIDLQNGSELSRAPLTERGGIVAGELPIADEPGIYGLQLHIPETPRGARLVLVPGPYIVVK